MMGILWGVVGGIKEEVIRIIWERLKMFYRRCDVWVEVVIWVIVKLFWKMKGFCWLDKVVKSSLGREINVKKSIEVWISLVFFLNFI